MGNLQLPVRFAQCRPMVKQRCEGITARTGCDRTAVPKGPFEGSNDDLRLLSQLPACPSVIVVDLRWVPIWYFP